MLDEEIEPHGNSPNSTALGHDQPLWLPLVSVISVITASMDIIFEHIITILIPVKHYQTCFILDLLPTIYKCSTSVSNNPYL